MSIGNAARRVYGFLLKKPWNFGWFEEGRLAGCGRPMSEEEVKWLKGNGIDAIVSLTQTPLPEEWVSANQLDFLHVPMKNHAVPPVEDLDRAVRYIEKTLKEGKGVAVHCAAGQGRTGTVLAAYLIKAEGVSPEGAIATVRGVRPGSIEKVQEEALHGYHRFLAQEKS